MTHCTRAVGAMVAALACGCATTGAPALSASKGAAAPNREEQAANGRALATSERQAFEQIAASDPRFAIRLGAQASDAALRKAALASLLAEDEDAMVHDGTLDFFSFAARKRGLDLAGQIVAKAPGAPALAADAQLERELAVRVVGEERTRLDEERDLPRGASELVRGMVDTWGPPASIEAVAERDRWVARRLDQVRSSIERTTLPHAELVELDDALDPLERLAAPSEYPAAAGALARLRVALGNVPVASARDASWSRVERALAAHLGVTASPAQIRARLDAARQALRRELAPRIQAARHADDHAVTQGAEALAFAPSRCEAPHDAPARALAPPPERAPICGALRALAEAQSDEAWVIALAALELETTAAIWSLDIHAEGADPDQAQARTRPLFAPPPEREARLLRLSVARPTVTLGAGLAAELLTRVRSEPLRARAQRWLAFGDAPLDVVERELFTPEPAPR